MALDALARLANSAPALPLRVLELVARDKACEHPDKACHGESCPLARGFYDRLPAARAAARGPTMDRHDKPVSPLCYKPVCATWPCSTRSAPTT